MTHTEPSFLLEDPLMNRRLRLFERSLWFLVGVVLVACVFSRFWRPTLLVTSMGALVGAVFFALNFSVGRLLLVKIVFGAQRRWLYALLYLLKMLVVFGVIGFLVLSAYVSVLALAVGFLVFPLAVLFMLLFS